ncbi:MAG: response regulator transcription factor [Actinomycetota bacterium]|nr:response regulator transcription factor [Actinomycetota bacterium]
MVSVLVVEDDPTVCEVVTKYLEREGFEVEAVGNGSEALRRAQARRPDLVVLDLMLPGIDGLEVCRRLREHGPVPVIMLTAKGDEDDRVLGLELGADDYMSKPFSPRELVSRVKAVLRRAGSEAPPEPQSIVEVGDLSVDAAARLVRRAGTAVALTVREFDLLVFMMRHANTAFSREELLERVWGFTYGDTSTVTVHIRRLREKIELDPAHPMRISTVWGVGYRFDS